MTSIVGFTAGGPISICRIGEGPVYVTCELSCSPGQKPSAQGLKFELLSRLPLSETDTQDFLSHLANLLPGRQTRRSTHTVDVSAISSSPDLVKIRLKLYSSCEIEGERYGIYEVCNADDASRH